MQKKELTPEDRDLLIQLKAEQDKSDSAADFVREYLPFSSSKWSKILNAIDPDAKTSYFDEVSAASGRTTLNDLADILRGIPGQRERANRINTQNVIELSQFRAVKTFVDDCGAKRSPERLVKYLAPTGGGKTMLCSYLARKFNAKVVESREAWKRSYYTVLDDLATALGCRLSGEKRTAAIEEKLVNLLASQKTLLVIDEGEFFGASAINGLKFLLNRTRLTIVICAVPEAHDKWNRYYSMEASQLDRRTHAIVRLTQIEPEDAAKFFPANQFESEGKALATICKDASHFGAYSLISRVVRRLENRERADHTQVANAIRLSLNAMNRTPIPTT